MENKLRNITVAGQSFVYWYSSGESFILNISPKIIKTLKIYANTPNDDPVMF